MATAEYRQSKSKITYKPMATYVKLTMTLEEHRDMTVAMQLACLLVSNKPSEREQKYLDRLRTLYDHTFKPSEEGL